MQNPLIKIALKQFIEVDNKVKDAIYVCANETDRWNKKILKIKQE